jgi:cytochrome c-type biogenesis protein CcmH/NrfF
MKHIKYFVSLPIITFMLISFALVIYPKMLKAQEQTSQNEKVAQDVFGEINSPFCKGKLLRDCPSSGASSLKQEVIGLASTGLNKDQIITKLYAQYGDEIRATPTSGFMGSVAWLAPFVFLGVGFVILLIWTRMNTSKKKL